MNNNIHTGSLLRNIKRKQTWNPGVPEKYGLRSWLRFIFLLFFLTGLYLCASAQKISLNVTAKPLKEVLQSLRKQTGYAFVYNDQEIVKARPVTISVKGKELKEVLQQIFRNQSLGYEMNGKVITIVGGDAKTENKEKSAGQKKKLTITGIVTDTTGHALEGVTVKIKSTGRSVVTNGAGSYRLNEVDEDATLIFSLLGHASKSVSIEGADSYNAVLQREVSVLDEAVVIAYGTSTKRLNTGSVGSVKAKDIENQPVMNPLAALSGRIPGMTVTQQTGMPGGAFTVNVRGRTSINNSINNDPLFIIDGVPLANNNNGIGEIGSALTPFGGTSPFNTINPADIESIEVLKDADATSIYGSRGANGVILITTKRGKEGKTLFNVNVYTGINSPSRTADVMDTRQYLVMRKEALANDGVSADEFNAYDIIKWDTTRNTDWKKEFIGHSSSTLDANLSLSGGSALTQFLIGGGFHKEKPPFPGDLNDIRNTGHFSLNHQSSNQKFSLSFSGGYGGDRNRIISNDLTTSAMLMIPNNTALQDASGNLVWEDQGVLFDNPLSYLFSKYNSKIDNYRANLVMSYKVDDRLTLKNSFGANSLYAKENSTFPRSAQNPQFQPTGYANFSNSHYGSFIVEPQADYAFNIGSAKVVAMIGGTWQKNTTERNSIYASGYSSDALLESLTAAGVIDSKSSTNTEYKYAAVFGRINYRLKERYIINLTARRDGSSRFGPQYRYSNFGAIGGAWIFSEERWMAPLKGVWDFGKIRASYGTTGNDKIGDYSYLDTWTALSKTIGGAIGLNPTRLFNPDYRWEINKKAEVGMDLGFFKERILLTAGWYQNRSSNQLIAYSLPDQTGASSVIRNFPAIVQNTGFELQINSTNIKQNSFTWSSNFNISVPRNKLVSFPGLEGSSYGSYLVTGKSLSVKSTLKVNGVNKETGVYEMVAADGTLTSSPTKADRLLGNINIDPRFLGGFGNTIEFGNVRADLFFEFKKQVGRNYYGNMINKRIYPGMAYNMPVDFLDRWTPDHRESTLQKYTATPGSPAYVAASGMRQYDADMFYSDASYVRLKTVSISYSFDKLLRHLKLSSLRIYMNAQNLLTITGYKGGDPETQDIFRLSPLRTITFGLQASL